MSSSQTIQAVHATGLPAAQAALTAPELDAWRLVSAASEAARSLGTAAPGSFALGTDGQLQRLSPGAAGAVLDWDPVRGWESALAADDPRADLLDLYLPVCSATAERPITIGHLGQSLDGFIATPSGDSCGVTGPANILHLHRLRALSDAIVVGAGTVAADNPRLTTRLVCGRNPVRIVLDPAYRLSQAHGIFTDGEALTLRACDAGKAASVAARERGEDILDIAVRDGALDLEDLLRQLRARGYHRIFIEGGGVTVSSFLDAGLLDRLHIAVSPLLIGEGRPAVRLPSRVRLRDCLRLQHRLYCTGDDILFDCDLRAAADGRPKPAMPVSEVVRRIL